MAEVDRFAHLGIGLIDGLSGLGSGHLNQLPTACGEDVADAVQRGRPLLGSEGLPGVRRLGAGLDETVDRLVRGQRLSTGAHGLDTPRRAGDGLGDLASPLAIGRQGRI